MNSLVLLPPSLHVSRKPASAAQFNSSIALRYLSSLLELVHQQKLPGMGLTACDTALPTSIDGRIGVNLFSQVAQQALPTLPSLGLLFGSHINITFSGVLGQAMMSCEDLQKVLQLMTDYYPLAGNPVKASASRVGDQAIITIDVPEQCRDDLPLARFYTEYSLVCWLKQARYLSGKELQFHEIRLAYPEPAYAGLYQPYAKQKVQFNCTTSELRFPYSCLITRLPTANPVANRLGVNLCDKKLAELVQPLNLRDLIERIMMQYPATCSLELVAQKLGINSRKLRENLQQLNLNFRFIQQQFLFKLSKQLLLEKQLNTDQVASILGYNDSANFRRAFKKWSGVAPRTFVNQQVVN